MQSLWPSAAGELISSSRLLPWDAFLATKGIREAEACVDCAADGGGVSWQVRMLTYADVCMLRQTVSWQVLHEKKTRQELDVC
jgi:hypothetical protein